MYISRERGTGKSQIKTVIAAITFLYRDQEIMLMALTNSARKVHSLYAFHMYQSGV
jgi:hypothetical protein